MQTSGRMALDCYPAPFPTNQDNLFSRNRLDINNWLYHWNRRITGNTSWRRQHHVWMSLLHLGIDLGCLFRGTTAKLAVEKWVIPLNLQWTGIEDLFPSQKLSPFDLAICRWIFSSSIGVVTTIWHVPAPAPARICRCIGNEPSLHRVHTNQINRSVCFVLLCLQSLTENIIGYEFDCFFWRDQKNIHCRAYSTNIIDERRCRR